ncbi:MAG: DUF1841 family protein [Gammaproteobacteria bacterium]|nr:DUF1841 family protein [Gammaproteobacteria bacterium]
MFSDNRDELRNAWITAWHKHRENRPMEPLEVMIADVIASHPEYHALFDDPEETMQQEWTALRGETNPFLHMGLHLALHEQLATDRPPGIREIHRRLTRRKGDRHAAEHAMIECLAEALWLGQRNDQPPDEAAYLERLKAL